MTNYTKTITQLLLAALGATACAQAFADENPGLQEMATDYYARKYGVSRDDARQRIELQDRAAGIDDAVAERLAGEFAGVWYDAADRGRLKIGVTRGASTLAEDLRNLARTYEVFDQTDLVTVRYSTSELERIQDTVRNSLMDMIMAGHARTGVNPRLNSVVVTTLTELPASEAERVAQIARTEGVVVRRWAETSLFVRPQICTAEFCNAPLRGGRFMKTLTDGWCTAGFTARHHVNTTHRLLITAGHCIWYWGIPMEWYSFDAAGNWKKIGPGYGYTYGGTPGLDAGVIYNQPGNDWGAGAPLAALIVEASSGSAANTTYDATYAIKQDSTSSLGQVLCMTGGYSGTQCAEVSDLGADHVINFASVPVLLKNLGELDTCSTWQGDSGAPIYKKHKAFGIHVHTFTGITTCHTGYQGIRGAQKALNVDLLLSP